MHQPIPRIKGNRGGFRQSVLYLSHKQKKYINENNYEIFEPRDERTGKRSISSINELIIFCWKTIIYISASNIK